VTGGPHDAGILDTGVQQNHSAFAGKRFESNAGTTDTGSHGTAVCGMTCSGNATYRGVAHGVDTISVALAGSDSTSMSGMNYLMTGVTERAENVNYSFGNGTANGTDYANIDRFFDGVADTFGVMVSKSTGNGGFSSGSPTITHPAPAYNILAVGALDDLNTTSRSDDRIASYSSTGPTLGGRKKPDVSAPGSNINSALPSGGFGATGSGTSYAAPHVGGSILLLAAAGNPSRLASKAVLINNAQAMDSRNTSSTGDDVQVNGSFWDRRYGWGYIDLGRAQLHAPDVFERTIPAPTSSSRVFRLFRGPSSPGDKATLVWNRHVAFNGASYPTVVRNLSNLDLVAYLAATGAQAVASASTIDNVEQVGLAGGDHVLKVATTGLFDAAVTTERFALATEEGFSEAVGPAFTAVWLPLAGAGSSREVQVRVRLTNAGDLPAFGATARLSGWRVVSGANPAPLGTVQPGGSVDAVWTVKSPGGGVRGGTRVDVESTSFGEPWSWAFVR
jgi:serine protease AprX